MDNKIYVVAFHHETGAWGEQPYQTIMSVYSTKGKAEEYIKETLKDVETEIVGYCEELDVIFNIYYKNENGKAVDYDWYGIGEYILNQGEEL